MLGIASAYLWHQRRETSCKAICGGDNARLQLVTMCLHELGERLGGISYRLSYNAQSGKIDGFLHTHKVVLQRE